MNPTAQHSPLALPLISSHGTVDARLRDSNGFQVATGLRHDHAITIARAVNSHAQLISLMERAKFYLMADAHKSPGARELVRLMDAALAAATQPTGKQ